jgi:hypothetical protein
MLEVDVEPLALGEQGLKPRRPARKRGLVVGRLSQPQVAEGRAAVQRVDELDALDAGPRLMTELECVLQPSSRGRLGGSWTRIGPSRSPSTRTRSQNVPTTERSPKWVARRFIFTAKRKPGGVCSAQLRSRSSEGSW